MNSALKCRCVQTSSSKKPSVDHFSQLTIAYVQPHPPPVFPLLGAGCSYTQAKLTTSRNLPLNLHILGGNLWDVPLYILLCLSNDVFNPSPIYFMRKSLFAEERSLKIVCNSNSFVKTSTTYNTKILKYTGTKWGRSSESCVLTG